MVRYVVNVVINEDSELGIGTVLYLSRNSEWRMNRNYQQLAAGPEQTVVSSLCGVRSIVPRREYMMTHELQSKVKINKSG